MDFKAYNRVTGAALICVKHHRLVEALPTFKNNIEIRLNALWLHPCLAILHSKEEILEHSFQSNVNVQNIESNVKTKVGLKSSSSLRRAGLKGTNWRLLKYLKVDLFVHPIGKRLHRGVTATLIASLTKLPLKTML